MSNNICNTQRPTLLNTRLMFDLSSAAEKFQHLMQQVLVGIDRAKNISDDIFVFGKDQASHDIALRKVLQRLHEKGLTLGKEKCQFNVPEVKFHGHTFPGKGVSPDPVMVKAIINMTRPNTAKF